MATNQMECISDVASTNAEFETIGSLSTDDEWEVCTDDGFEDEVPMPNVELSRIRTGDLDSLPLEAQQHVSPMFFTTAAPVWQSSMMMPAYGTTLIDSAVAFSQPFQGLIKSHVDSPTACDMLSDISELQDSAAQTQSTQLLSVSTDEERAPTEPLCGNGRCRPCYDHIRGKCAKGEACTYCHAPIHAIRRKQRKHQRRAQAFQQSLVHGLDTANSFVKTNCCDGVPHTKCQPCYRHMRGACALGAECAYCHSPVHAQKHAQRAKA